MHNACVQRRTEQRRCPRYVPPRRTVCRLSRAISSGPWAAVLRNISAEGIGLALRCPLKRGMLLTVELPCKDQPGLLKTLLVTHAAAQPGGWWIVGGRFASPLDAADLRGIM